jgi:CRISPR-associated protein Cas5d
MKVERVSYDVITPSAARAIFEAILWKPAIRWRVTQIEVLEPIRWISVRRNEVGKVATPRADGIFIEEERQQRAGLFLRDVKYRLHGEFDFIPPEERARVSNPVPEWLIDRGEAEMLGAPDVRADETEAKYAAMFDRRASKGQCFVQPYLGCREFSCAFRLVKNGSGQDGRPIDDTRDLGWMLNDLDFTNPDDPKPMFFRPRLESGVIVVPHPDSEEVRR